MLNVYSTVVNVVLYRTLLNVYGTAQYSTECEQYSTSSNVYSTRLTDYSILSLCAPLSLRHGYRLRAR